MARKRSWAEMLEASTGYEVRPVPEGRRGAGEGKTMLFPSARMLDDAIRGIPRGKTVSTRELRDELARRHDASFTCPVTATMMLRIVAEAAHEAHQNGAPLSDVTPVWRVLDRKASALRKLTFDPRYLLDERAREGEHS
jgi:hypothetical protein